MDCEKTSPIPIPVCFDYKNDLLEASKENERNERCLSYQNELKTPVRQCLVFSPPDSSQSFYLTPADAANLKSPILLKSPNSSLVLSPFQMDNNAHLHSTCDSNLFQSPNSIVQSSFCSLIDFRQAVGSPNWKELQPVAEALVTSSSEKDEFDSCLPTKVDVSVQCQFPVVADELLAYFLKKLEKSLEWPRKFIQWIKVIVNSLCERLRTQTFPQEPCKCNCFDKIAEIEAKLKSLETEIYTLRINSDAKTEKPIPVIEGTKSAVNCGPALPPPPPPPPPPPGLLAFKPLTFKAAATKTPAAVTTPRPSVTVQDLLSVRLRKVGDRPLNDTLSGTKSHGPMVTIDQLRSVKLRPRRKTPNANQSPTRTPLTRDRMRKLRSSPGYRKERRPRIDRIPLSTILNMDES